MDYFPRDFGVIFKRLPARYFSLGRTQVIKINHNTTQSILNCDALPIGGAQSESLLYQIQKQLVSLSRLNRIISFLKHIEPKVRLKNRLIQFQVATKRRMVVI